MAASRESSRLISLRSVLPIASALFLAAVVSVFGTIAYRAVRESTLLAAAERLRTVAQALTRPNPALNNAWIREASQVAGNPSVLQLVRSGGKRSADSAAALIKALTPDTGQTVLAEVRRVDGGVLLTVHGAIMDSVRWLPTDWPGDTALSLQVNGKGTPQGSVPDRIRLLTTYPADTSTISPLYLRAGEVLFERSVPIRDGTRHIGQLVELDGDGKAPATPLAAMAAGTLAVLDGR